MIKLIKPYISFEDVAAEFREVFESGCFTRGKYVSAFAEKLCSYTGAKYAFLTTSATTALWMCMRLLGIGKGDEVIVSDFSFPATANIVEDVGARPVFADVGMDTFNMLPEELERKITPQTKAVIFVDALGNPSGIHAIKEICRRRNIPLIEDAACAIGSSERCVHCGNIADLTCFSFHPRKLLTTGEGGAITTGNDEWAENLAVKLAHGAVTENGKFDFIDYGYNFRLPELQAVMGIKQLEKIDEIVRDRNLIRDAYNNEMNALGFCSQQVNHDVVHNVQSLVFRVPPGCNRDALIDNLRKQNVESTLGTYCLSGLTYYRRQYNDIQSNSRLLQEQTITLPCYGKVDALQVCNRIRNALKTSLIIEKEEQ